MLNDDHLRALAALLKPWRAELQRLWAEDDPSEPPRSEVDERPEVTEQLAYSPAQAAEQLGIGKSTMYRLMVSGEIQYIRIGRLRRIPRTELARFVEQSQA